jgi:hypothetical protein
MPMLAKHLLKSDSKAHYECCDDQMTIRNIDALNEDGQRIYAHVQDLLERRTYTGTITSAVLVISNSGNWYEEPKHPAYVMGNIKGYLNSWRNLLIKGTREKDNQDVQTSVIRFYSFPENERTGWAYTVSGSLYFLVRP